MAKFRRAEIRGIDRKFDGFFKVDEIAASKEAIVLEQSVPLQDCLTISGRRSRPKSTQVACLKPLLHCGWHLSVGWNDLADTQHT